MITRAIKFIKANLFLVVVLSAYFILTLLTPQMGLQAVKNSSYYIKEMRSSLS